MKTMYITVIDKTTEPDEGRNRVVSLGMNARHPETLRLLGGLSHSTDITFDKQNAKKLIGWLEELL